MGYEVYETLYETSVRCEGCNRWIERGERFLRLTMVGGGSRRYPFCRRCEPFEEEDERDG